MLDFINCDSCGCLGKPVLRIDEFNIYECKNCSLRYLNPQPSQEYLKNFYTEKYYDNYVTGGYLVTEVHIKKFWAEHLDEIESNFNLKEANLLEIGSACGLFLKYCRDRGWENIMGVEFSDWSSAYARDNFNLRVITGDLNNISFPENKFDIIIMWATIEHLREPKKTIEKIYRLLKNGGRLILNTGNDEPFYRLLSSGYCMWYNVPEHLFFYNSKTIFFLLQRIGFINIKIIKDHIAFKQIFHLIMRKLKKWIFNPGQLNRRSDFGKLMTIYGHKPL